MHEKLQPFQKIISYAFSHIETHAHKITEVHEAGGNKEPGMFAIYLKLWHDGIFNFIYLRKDHRKEEAHAIDPFYMLWISDL